MRASAASQINSPANIPAPQAKPDVNKADAASPFALLVEVAAAKDPAKGIQKSVKENSDRIADEKTAVSKNDGKQSEIRQNDNKRDKAPVQTASEAKPEPAKAGKLEKGKDDAKVETEKNASDDKQIAATEQQTPDQQAPLPPATFVQVANAISAPAEPVTQAQEDSGIECAAPTAETAPASPSLPSSGTDLPQPASTDAAAQPEAEATAQPQPQSAAQPVQADATETTDPVAAQSVPPPAVATDAKPIAVAKDTAKPAAVKTAANSEATTTINSETADIESAKDEPAQTAESVDAPVQAAQSKPAKTDAAQDDGTNAVGAKGHAAPDNVASNAKIDAGTTDSPKTDTAQANAHPADADAAQPLPKAAPQSASVTNANFAINTIAAPQAVQHAQAPSATQHVQVTAQPAPNLPALAVEISAKSQSGAKQFDIRLDPPELGRVEVRLSIDATGKASAHLSADQPQTLTLLQKDAPVLARALREAGLDVSQDGLNFSLRQQAQGQNGHEGNNNGRFGGARSFSLAATASIDPAAASFAYRGTADGRVDIRV